MGRDGKPLSAAARVILLGVSAFYYDPVDHDVSRLTRATNLAKGEER
jgi:hypothetical protein